MIMRHAGEAGGQFFSNQFFSNQFLEYHWT